MNNGAFLDFARSPSVSGTAARRASASILTVAVALAVATAAQPASLRAQSGMERVNKANWALAEKFSSQAIQAATYSTSVSPGWVRETDSLWYRWEDHTGATFFLVQPKLKQKKALFDHEKLAAALSTLHRKPMDPKRLPFNTVTWMEGGKTIRFTVDSLRYELDLNTEQLTGVGLASDDSTAGGRGGGRGGRGGRGGGGGGGRGRGGGGGAGANFRNFSPDSTHFAFAKEHNLFVVVVATGDTIQLTDDGAENYSFGFRDTTTTQDEDSAFVAMELDPEGIEELNAFYNNSDLPGDEERFVQQQQQQQQQQQGGRGQVQGRGRGGQGRGQQQVQGRGRGGGRGAAQANRDPRVRANVVWSEDSKTFYVTRSDNREVEQLYLVNVLSEPRPTLTSYRYAMPGEENVAQTELFAWQVGDRTARKLPIEKWKDQRVMDLHYTPSSDKIRLFRRDRLQRNGELIEVDLSNGNSVTPLITESVVDANIEPATWNVRYMNDSLRTGDMVMWSERTGWGHFYLYDNQGKLKNAITAGPWRAESVVEIDAEKRQLYFSAVGREAGENPYYSHLYRVNLDGTGLTLLNPGNGTHTSNAGALSPSKRYVVDNYSRTDMTPKAVLRDAAGATVMELEEADLSRLHEMGWKMPTPFVVKAADGVTDIYGNIFTPFDLDSTKKYPIIASIYPGPQTEQVTYSFTANAAQQRLAQLGFIVVQIGNRGGSPQRSNAYQSFSYYNLRDYGLADKKAGIEQLAARYSWIDIDRVGMYGHSGGGFMTAAALLVPPYNDFFKVGVSSSGNHDNNVYNQNWSEQYHGLREVRTPREIVADGNSTGGSGNGQNAGGQNGNGGNGSSSGSGSAQDTSQYDVSFEIHVPTNAEVAANLKGRLLLVHGDMDNNVHHAGTVRLARALIENNKRFDMFTMPGSAHGYGQQQAYFNRMLYEYFAEHLMGDYYRAGAEIREPGGR